MRQKMKRMMGILLSLVMVLGLVPGMSLKAYAENWWTYTMLMLACGRPSPADQTGRNLKVGRKP